MDNGKGQYGKYAEQAAKTAEVEFCWWKPEAAGESITGKVLFYGTDEKSKFSEKTIKLDDGNGHVFGRGVAASLIIELEQAQVARDDIISIIYRGEKQTKTGTTFKKFDVLVHERASAGIPF